MADTNIPVTPGSGANIDGYSLDNSNFRQSVVIGSPTTAAAVAPVDATKGLAVDLTNTGSNINPIQISQTLEASNLCQSVTAATGVGVTVTLPAVVSQFHYITLIEITKYFTATNAASATPLVVTTTNLPGSLAFTFGQPLGTVGTTDDRILAPETPLKSSVLNTATTIVCPATTGIIWRVNILYFSAS